MQTRSVLESCKKIMIFVIDKTENLGFVINSVSKWMTLINNCCKTISSHFFAIYMFIFHKPEVQTVVLIYSAGLNFNWFKNYGLKCSLRLRTTLANSQKIATDKWPFYDHFWLFFAIYMFIFHKTEIKTVILSYLPSLNLN